MGHYVADDAFRLLLLIALVYLAGFAFVNWGFSWLTGIFGGSWHIRLIDDPAGLPVLAALATIFSLLATPVTNAISRTTEIHADIFGINATRKPDAFATAVLKLSTYRKLDPSSWEEAIFYDHPSGRTRIWEAMRWKAEHLNDPDIKAGPQSPQ
jgi:STE24 endopeptidase